ncbi:MAG TPA: hypothetical protein EYG74_03315 [Sulfurimonas autotrophica]|nr:hypothetical protein [Sulfurimonas autotrophica]
MKNPYNLINKIVEEGSQNKFTLLYIKNAYGQTVIMQNILKQTIVIENNQCNHTYEVILGEFLENKKVCEVCKCGEGAELPMKKIYTT